MKLNNKIVIIIVILSAILLVLNKNNIVNKYNFNSNNIKIETIKKGYIPLTDKQEQTIKKYLENQSLTETNNPIDCIIVGEYKILFNDYTISFDKGLCNGYLKTKDNYYQVDISEELAKYIIKISK